MAMQPSLIGLGPEPEPEAPVRLKGFDDEEQTLMEALKELYARGPLFDYEKAVPPGRNPGIPTQQGIENQRNPQVDMIRRAAQRVGAMGQGTLPDLLEKFRQSEMGERARQQQLAVGEDNAMRAQAQQRLAQQMQTARSGTNVQAQAMIGEAGREANQKFQVEQSKIEAKTKADADKVRQDHQDRMFDLDKRRVAATEASVKQSETREKRITANAEKKFEYDQRIDARQLFITEMRAQAATIRRQVQLLREKAANQRGQKLEQTLAIMKQHGKRAEDLEKGASTEAKTLEKEMKNPPAYEKVP